MRFLPRVGGLPRAYWYLVAGMFLNRAGAFVVPLLSFYLKGQRGLGTAEVGATISCWGLGALAAAPVGGALADRLGRRTAMLSSLVLGAATMLGMSVARTPAGLAAAAMLLGFFGEAYRPASAAMVSDLVAPEDRVRAYGFLYWAVNLGFAVAPVLGGLLASRSFGVLFIADAATTLLFAGVVAARLPETRPAEARASRGLGLGALSRPYRDPHFLAFAACQLLLALVFLQGFVGLPLAMLAHGIPPERYGALIAINGILIVLIQPFAVEAVAAAHRGRALALGAFVAGLGFGANALAGGPLGYAGAIVVWTAGEIIFSSATPSVISDLAPIESRGGYQGAYQMTWAAAAALAPGLGALVLERAGARALWGGCLLLGTLSALGHLAIAPARARLLARSLRPDAQSPSQRGP